MSHRSLSAVRPATADSAVSDSGVIKGIYIAKGLNIVMYVYYYIKGHKILNNPFIIQFINIY